MIPDSFIQELLARVDIVTVIERFVTLKKSGANYSACCPFHNEKTPSFTVSPVKQFYYCFGCGASGSALGFLMQYSGLDFVGAVEELAQSVGIAVPHTSRSAKPAPQASLADLMAEIASFYQEQLRNHPQAMAYLERRGLSQDVISRYALGYAPAEWQGLARLVPDYAAAALVECGMVIVNEQGRRYDRFRDRIMFPILNQRGQVIAFGGRVLDSGEPKYLNSPETPLFSKGRELFGLPQARAAIRTQDSVIVVEGYMDVVGLAQLGVQNVVASLGTALSGHNIQRLLKSAQRLIFCFDRDAAGDRAARRAMENSLELLQDGKSVEILQMPGSQDPDEYIREHGAAAFAGLLAQGTTRLSEFLLREIRKPAGASLQQQFDLTSAEGRAQLVQEAKPLLQKIVAPLLRLQICKDLSKLAGISQEELEAQCALPRLRLPALRRAAAHQRYAQPQSLSYHLLCLIVRNPDWSARLPLDLVEQTSLEGQALHDIADAVTHGELPSRVAGVLVEFARHKPYAALLDKVLREIASLTIEEGVLEQEFEDVVSRLQQSRLSATINTGGYRNAEELRALLLRKQEEVQARAARDQERVAGS